MTRVEDESGLREALADGVWDVVICDVALPRFSAPDALAVVQSSSHDLPFIVVSHALLRNITKHMMPLSLTGGHYAGF